MDVSNHTQSTQSRSNSPASSSSELEKEIAELDVNGDGRLNGSDVIIGQDDDGEPRNGDGNGHITIATKSIGHAIKKRISSSRTPTRKAKRVRFYRNGDRFYAGIVIPVSQERYRYVQYILHIRYKCISGNFYEHCDSIAIVGFCDRQFKLIFYFLQVFRKFG